jgi:hypothetical protein
MCSTGCRTSSTRMPDAMGVRRQTVEHPFGTLKAWMGATHFLTRTLDKVRTEMSLHVLAYNLKRMITIFGVGPLMAAIRTGRSSPISLTMARRVTQSGPAHAFNQPPSRENRRCARSLDESVVVASGWCPALISLDGRCTLYVPGGR